MRFVTVWLWCFAPVRLRAGQIGAGPEDVIGEVGTG
jgi:hypothetical protein